MRLLKTIFIILTLVALPACSGAEQNAVQTSQSSLPPEPDPAINNSTVAGVDSNGDGIRDDVERWIAKNYQTGTPQYFAMRQMARTQQKIIVEADKIDNSNRHDYDLLIGKASACLVTSFDTGDFKTNVEQRHEAFSNFMTLMVNTSDRFKALRESDHKFAGIVSRSQYGEPGICENR